MNNLPANRDLKASASTKALIQEIREESAANESNSSTAIAPSGQLEREGAGTRYHGPQDSDPGIFGFIT